MSRTRRSFALALVLCAVACGRPPATHYYLLELTPDRAAGQSSKAAQATGPSIGVGSFEIRPPYDQDRIVYRIGNDSPEVGFYAYHRWAAPLSRMLPVLVIESLRNAPGLSAVEVSTTGRRHECRLDGTLVRLEEIDVGEEQRVRLRLELVMTASDGVEIWSDALDAESSTRSSSVKEIVVEMGRLLERELTTLQPAISAASAACTSRGPD